MSQSVLVNRLLLSLTLSLSAIVGSTIGAQAQTIPTAEETPAQSQKVQSGISESSGQEATPAINQSTPTSDKTSTNPPAQVDAPSVKEPTIIIPQKQKSPIYQPPQVSVGEVPVPGTASTSTAGLQAQTEPSAPTSPAPLEAPAPAAAPAAVQTRYKFSYVGFGVNLGTGSGETALGSISFAAFSKFALSPDFSFRPTVLVSDDASFLLPFTYDFPNRGPGTISPYVGIGPIFSTGKDDNVDLLITAGLDYPLNPQLALTSSVNIAPINKFDIGFILGLAYTFGTETITTPAPSLSNLIPSQPPRPNPSYFGLGVNLGTGGESGLGDISAAIYSKIALGSSFSFRPAVLIASDVSFLLPITYDFRVIRLSDYIRFAPYVGLGATFSTGNENNVDLLVTGGVDIPLSDQFAATVGVNIAPIDNFDIGFLLGVAYTFGRFE